MEKTTKKNLEEDQSVQVSETKDEKMLRFTRQCRHFIEYIGYDWNNDMEWENFKKTNLTQLQSPKQMEEIKREYFKIRVNNRIDTGFTLQNETEKEEFLEMCKYAGTILSIGQIFKAQSLVSKYLCHLKHILYFAFILSFPLRTRFPKVLIFVAAHICSLVQRKKTMSPKDSFLQMMVADEESMHAMWFLTYLLLNWQLQFFVDLIFFIWAYLNTCEWFDYMNVKHPKLPVLSLLASTVKKMQDNTITIVTIKNYIEVIIVPVSFVAWLFNWCAPVLGVILIQAVRIKYMGSNYTRKVLKDIDNQFENILPHFLYTGVVTRLKNWLITLIGVQELVQNKKDTGANLGESDVKKGSSKRKPRRQLSKIDEQEEEEEPKTYEVAAEDLD